MRTGTILASLLMVTTGLVALPSSNAVVACALGEPVQPNDARTSNSLGLSSYWYVHKAVGPATTTLYPQHLFERLELRVWDRECGTLLCATSHPFGGPAYCSVDGDFDYNVEVRRSGLGQGAYAIQFRGQGYAVDLGTDNGGAPDRVDVIDRDRDGIPDAVEMELCGRPILRDNVNRLKEVLGECRTSQNFEGPAYADQSFLLQSGVKLGPDADRDGVNATLAIQQTWVNVTAWTAGERLTVKPGPDYATSVLDANDADPNVPLQSVFRVGPVYAGAAPGPDGDRDGVPGSLVLLRSNVTFDRRDGRLAVTPAPGGSLQVDPDDADSYNPAPNVPGTVEALRKVVDKDLDGIPDLAEPLLCQVEHEEQPHDGSCDAAKQDYTRPPLPRADEA